LANIQRFARLDCSNVHYVLVETPAMCRTVRDEIEARGGRVVEEIPDAVPSPLIVNAGSSLQYVSDYRAVLSRLTPLTPQILIVSQTPGQRSPHLCAATRVFNRQELVADLRSLGYRLAFTVDHDLPLTHGKAPGPSVVASLVFTSAAS